MKAQAEFIVILAIILVSIVAIFVLLQQNVARETPAVTGPKELGKPVIDSIKNVVKDLTLGELKSVYNKGGYLSETGEVVNYGSLEIGVWQECGRVGIPNIENMLSKNIKEGVEKILKPEIDFFGRKVNFEVNKLQIDVNILRDFVKVDVNLPTKMDGAELEKSYVVSIPSKLYDILQFSRNFVQDSSNYRFFEENALDVIMRSNPNSEHWLPVIGSTSGCDNPLYRGKNEILSSLEKIFEYTASHTVWNRETLNITENPFYKIRLSGFSGDLNVSFVYPEEWDLESNSFFSKYISIPSQVTSFSSVCLASYNIPYSFRYPVVVLVEDTLLNDLFKFAVMINVENNKPNDKCILGFEVGETDWCSTHADCYAEIRVMDTKGMPVDRALVTFDECAIGKTNDFGITKGWVPCFFGELRAYKNGYSTYGEFLGANELKNFLVTLKPRIDTNLHLYGVPMKRVLETPDKKFEVVDQPKPLNDLFSKYVVLTRMRKIDHGVLDKGFFLVGKEGQEIKMEDPGAGLFNFFSVAVNEIGYVVGYSNVTYMSDGDEEILYIYIPVLVENYPVYHGEITEMKEVLDSCNIEHVSKNIQSVVVPCD